MTGARVRLAGMLAVRDPGHARLVAATSVTLGVLLSVGVNWAIVHALHASTGLLSVAVFLSMQAGNIVKDATPAKRLVTALLLIPVAVGVILLVSLLLHLRPLAIAGFVITVGVAIGARRFGHRASALGAIAFMSYFFGLFMLPHTPNMWEFLLVAVCALASQVVVRLVLLVRRPVRQLRVLLNELREGSLEVLRAAQRVTRSEDIKMLLAHTDDVGRAISGWQGSHDTLQSVGVSAEVLESRVLDARVDIEEAGFEIVRAHAAGEIGPLEEAALARLEGVLTDKHDTAELAAAAEWAQDVIEPTDGRRAAGQSTVVYLLARATRAHVRLAELDIAHPRQGEKMGAVGDPASPSQPTSKSGAAAPAAATPTTSKKRLLAWREWSSSSRMVLQAMIAAALASAVGEAISASRWYWAVMTAFVIFIGASTRGGILTRASRRIVGTLLGIALGAGVVFLVGHSTVWLTVLVLLAIFGMLYFGPLNYVYMATFMTTMLVVVYRMLGILDVQILELRLVETVTGAIIGVLSAYLILSTSSRPAVSSTVTSYLDALTDLLGKAQHDLSSPHEPATAIAALNRLEVVQADVDKTMTDLSTALIGKASRADADAVHMMYVATRAAARLVQSTSGLRDGESGEAAAASRAVCDTIATVEQSVGATRAALLGEQSTAPSDGDSSGVLSRLQEPGMTAGSPGVDAIRALARMNWALHRVRAA